MRVWALILMVLCSGGVQGQAFGPIQTRNHRALSLPFLRILPQGPLVPSGSRVFEFSLTQANESRLRGVVGDFSEEDYEISRLALRLRQSLEEGAEVLIEAPIMIRGGGFLDPIIERLHGFLIAGWEDPFRASVPRGRSVINIPGASYGSAVGMGDVTLQVARDIGAGSVGIVAIKLPTGNASDLLGSGSIDIGAAVAHQVSLGSQWRLYLQGGLIVQGPAHGAPRARSTVELLSWALIWQPNSRDAWIIQWQHEASGLLTGAPGSDGPHRAGSIGWQRRVGEGQMLELYFSQDNDIIRGQAPILLHIAPDFTMGVRWARKL